MNRKTASLIFCSFFYLTAFSQSVENLIKKVRETGAADNIYLHLDKEIYLPGETVFFKAYNNDPDETILSVNLADNKNIVVDSKQLLLHDGTASGFFILPTGAAKNYFVINAYTTGMMLADSTNIYTRIVSLQNDCGIYRYSVASEANAIRFFPEAGFVVDGLSTTIAFNGNTASFNGEVFDNTDTMVASFDSYFNGMGKFDLMPEAGKTYYAMVNSASGKEKILLDLPRNPAGVLMNVASVKNGFAYRIRSAQPGRYLLLVEKDLELRYKDAVSINDEQGYSRFVSDTVLKEGVNHFMLLNDNNGKVVAERFFYNHSEKNKNLQVQIDKTLSADNELLLNFKELPVDFSVSITAADELPEDVAAVSGSFAPSITMGQRSTFFKGTIDSVKQKMDLVSMLEHPRKHTVSNLQKLASIKRPDELAQLSVIGMLTNADNNQVLKNLKLSVVVKQGDSSSMFIQTKTDENGMLTLGDGNLIMDSATVFFKQPSDNYPRYPIKLNRDKQSLRVLPIPELAIVACGQAPAGQQKINTTDNLIALASKDNIVLNEIVVKSVYKSPTQLPEERYVSPVFSSPVHERARFDFVNDFKTVYTGSVLDFLKGRVIVNGLTDFSKAVLLLNESQVDAEVMSGMNVFDVALIKVMGPNFISPEAGKGVTVLVYTKKGSDNSGSGFGSGKANIKGIAADKPYFNPPFDKKALGDDSRTTLYWNAYPQVDKDKILRCKLLNQTSKKVLVTVEGSDENGTPMFFSKLITVRN